LPVTRGLRQGAQPWVAARHDLAAAKAARSFYRLIAAQFH
jgi:hypothetical protein